MLRRCRPLLSRRFPVCRNLRVEPLEQRTLLSLPNVVDLNVSSTEWSSGFVDYLESNSLGTNGYRIPVGSSDQTATLSWLNIDQIRITFSEDVDVEAADLAVSGLNQSWYEIEDFTYDSSTYTAVWTMKESFSADKLLLDLDANGLDPVVDTDEANVLDGEWTNGTSNYPSGNGVAGGDFEFRLNIVPGDADASTGVATADMTMISALVGIDTSSASYNLRCDLDGDGLIEQADADAAQTLIGSGLASGDPAGVTNDAPTTVGIANYSGTEDDANQTIDLFAAFGDNENTDSQLTYQVVSNSNAALFASTTIDAMAGTLTLDFAENAFGSATLVVRATDAGGLAVDTSVTITLAAANDTPTTTGLNNVTVNVNAPNSVIDLFAAFADVEDADSQLTYQIISNTNPSLFTSTTIDGTAGTLTLDYANNASGTAVLTIRATDTSSAYVQTTLSVKVNRPPVVTNFMGENLYDEVWRLYGSVSDPDDDLTGRIVVFGGVLAPFNLTATIQANGSFSIIRNLAGLQDGDGTVTVTDPYGASDTDSYYFCYS